MNLESRKRKLFFLVSIIAIIVCLGASLVIMTFNGEPPIALQLFVGVMFTLATVALFWVLLDPDTSAARQSDEILQLASHMLDSAKEGFNSEAAMRICELLLPATPAIAVAITDREAILGYAGYNTKNNTPGTPIRTTATHEVIADGKPRILRSTDNIGLPMSSARISAAIIQPLYIGKNIQGTLKFYYRRSSQISATQKSLAHGFAELLSTQMAASALEEQTKLATSMELKALQAQINPHFLFNTINTIAALIRTDPDKARVLLREFAVFYRSTLEDSEDLIPLERELKQVERYFSFEVARFGEECLQLHVDIQDEVFNMLIPSFMIQPLVENAVKHARRPERCLTVRVSGKVDGGNIHICVEDDGVGMSPETVATMMTKGSTTGLGIAVKNVKDRLRGYFGPEATMEVKSELGRGTAVCFTLSKAVAASGQSQNEELHESAIPDIPQPVIEA